MAEYEMKEKLVLGAAGKKHDDAVTVDIDPLHTPDVVFNLNEAPLPFEDNSFKEIIAHHVIEHLDGLEPVMSELHRICHPEGVIHIEVPYHNSWMANIPEHKLRFSIFAFDGYLDDGTNSWLHAKKFKLINREICFHRAYRRYFLHKLFNKYPKYYERFWAYIVTAEFLKISLQPMKEVA